MRFALDAEQRAFAQLLEEVLAGAEVPAAVRAWARGEHGPGRGVWRRAADAGVFTLAVPQEHGGAGLLPVEAGVAFTALGRSCAPGPLVETVAAAVLLTRLAEAGEAGPARRWLGRLGAGDAVLTLAAPGAGPSALDADAADALLVVEGDVLRLAAGHGPVRASVDPARRLAAPDGGGEILATGRAVREAAAEAALWAAYATAAQALGVGLALLDKAVAHARRRTQFGRPVGSFQAVKHRLADTLVGLEFARPLLHGAGVALASGAATAAGEVAAAKAAAGEAAYAAARSALQVHGAMGYTAEYELSLWLGKARALRTAWGSPEHCRKIALAEFFDEPLHEPLNSFHDSFHE